MSYGVPVNFLCPTTWLGLAMACTLSLSAAAPAVPPTNSPPVGTGATTRAADLEEDEPANSASDASAPSAESSRVMDSPYQAIIVRNPFGLKTPPPAPPPPAEAAGPQVTPSALKLTGITTMLGGKRAMFVVQEPGKPQLTSDLVTEGEKDSVITNLEVLTIDEHAGVVKVVYGGKELALDFATSGLKAPVAAPTPAPGGAVPGRMLPVPGQPGVVATAAGVAGVHSGTQPGVQPGVQPTYQPGVPSFNPGVISTRGAENPSGLQAIPTRPTRLPFGSTAGAGNLNTVQANPQPNQPVLPPDQQALMMRAQEELSRQRGVPFPPSPPLPGIGAQPSE